MQRTEWWLPEGGGWGDWVKKMKGLRSTDWWLPNNYGDIKCSVGNIPVVDIIVITMYGAGWVLEISKGPLCE